MYSRIDNPVAGTPYTMDLHIAPGGRRWFRFENRSNLVAYIAIGAVGDAESAQMLATIVVPAWHAAIFHVELDAGVTPVATVAGVTDPSAPVPGGDWTARWVLRAVKGPAVPVVYRLRW